MSKDIQLIELPETPAKNAGDIAKHAKVFIFYATRFATLEEIASIFMCDQTIVEEYCQTYWNMDYTKVATMLANRGKTILRGTQFEVASQGDTKMLMFLGKNNLQQVDDNSKYLEVEGADKVIIVHNLENK
jgi:hypothetical protein